MLVATQVLMPSLGACINSRCIMRKLGAPQVALTYLYKSTSSPGVTDYLCNRLYTLPEEQVEAYLSQLCQLIVSRPHSPLERVLVDLCARSLRIAVKVALCSRHTMRSGLLSRFLESITSDCLYLRPRCFILRHFLRAIAGCMCLPEQSPCSARCRSTGCCWPSHRTIQRTSMPRRCAIAASAPRWRASGCAHALAVTPSCPFRAVTRAASWPLCA